MLAERSDIQEELVRMKTHIQHFLSLLDGGGEVGKKLDFLLQEMNREANTLLSKTTRRGRRRAAHHRAGAGHEIGNRESCANRCRTSNERQSCSSFRRPRAPANHADQRTAARIVPDLEFSITYTTRLPRGSEQNGREYFFISREEFERMIARGRIPGARRGLRQLLRHGAAVSARGVGARQRSAARHRRAGCGAGEAEGARGGQHLHPAAVARRTGAAAAAPRRGRRRNPAQASTAMARGGSMTEEIIQRRLQTASREIENFRQYDYILVNDRLEQSIDILKSIVEAERLKRSRCRADQHEDEQVSGRCPTARCARNMLQQVQDILATFDLSRSPSVTE